LLVLNKIFVFSLTNSLLLEKFLEMMYDIHFGSCVEVLRCFLGIENEKNLNQIEG
jgi:hypothetical protein